MAVTGAVRARLGEELWAPEDLSARPSAGFVEHAVVAAGGGLLVLPVRTRRASAAAMWRWTDTTPLRETSARLLASAALQLGLARPLLRDRIAIRTTTVAAGEPSLHDYLAAAVGAPAVELSFAFGSMRPNRKPVVRIHAPNGRTLGFAKVGWNPLTEALVAVEADLLQSPAVSRLRRMVVPTVLHRGRWQGRSVVVTSPLIGRPPVRRPAPPDTEVLVELAGMAPRSDAAMAGSAYRRAIDERLGRLAPDERDGLADALTRIDERFGAEVLGHGAWHGDWTPWNMRTCGDRLIVWDWERSGSAVPVGFDALHYEFHRRLSSSPQRSSVDVLMDATAAAAATLEQLGQPAVEAVAALYAVEMHLRFESADSVGWLPGLVAGAAHRLAD